MSILSPRVIEEIVNFSKTKGKKSLRVNSKISGLEILFTRKSVIFLTPGPLIKNLSASLSVESLQISQSEIDNVDKMMDFYIDIGTEISKYLN